MSAGEREIVAAAWKRALLGADGLPHRGADAILADLERFCPDAGRIPGLETGLPTDATKLGVFIGRRQVLCRIRDLLEPAAARPAPSAARPYDRLE